MEGHQEEKHTSSSCRCQRGFEIHAVWQRLFSDHCLGRRKQKWQFLGCRFFFWLQFWRFWCSRASFGFIVGHRWESVLLHKINNIQYEWQLGVESEPPFHFSRQPLPPTISAIVTQNENILLSPFAFHLSIHTSFCPFRTIALHGVFPELKPKILPPPWGSAFYNLQTLITFLKTVLANLPVTAPAAENPANIDDGESASRVHNTSLACVTPSKARLALTRQTHADNECIYPFEY